MTEPREPLSWSDTAPLWWFGVLVALTVFVTAGIVATVFPAGW
jgi:hypothetical protein